MRTVTLPALSFTALRRERAFLTSRPNARRMARHPQPKAPEWIPLPDSFLHAPSEPGWALLSLACIVLVIVGAIACCSRF